MKRKIIGAAAAYMSGLFFASFFFTIIGKITAVLFTALVIGLGISKGYKKADCIIILLSFTVAFTINRMYTRFVYDKIMSYSGSSASFSGIVSDVEEYDRNYTVYLLKGTINGSQKAKAVIGSDSVNADIGDRLTIESCLFSAPDSDYLYDSRSFDLSRHIFLEGTDLKGVTVTQADRIPIKRRIYHMKRKMISRMRVEIGPEAGAFLAGMIFGEKRYISGNTRSALYHTGIGHILAVSGLHVSVMTALLMRLLKKFNVSRYLRFILADLAMLLMIVVTNYPVSAIRAAIMLEIVYAAELFGQQNDPLNSLSLASLIICLSDPYILYNSGFILSVSGTFGLAVFSRYMTKDIDRGRLSGRLRTTFAAAVYTSMSVMPASLFFFDEASVIAPIANVLLVPLCSASMIFGLLYVITGGLFPVLLFPARVMIRAVIKISDISAGIGYFCIPETSSLIPVIFVCSAFLLISVYLMKNSRSAVSLCLAAVIAFDSAAVTIIRESSRRSPKIAVLGCKSNGAAVVSYMGNAVVIDLSGHHRTCDYVKKYLTENGMTNIEHLILTKRYESTSVAYMDALKFRKPHNVTDISEHYSVFLEYGDIAIECRKDETYITIGETEILLLPGKRVSDEYADITIYYGDPGSECTNGDAIYLTDMNNFEVLPQKDGGSAIRRL